jgi:predicted O-linked N-acetylglucosamine transferase (SPINDLY family)
MLGWLFRRRRAVAPATGAHDLLAKAYAHHQAGRLEEAQAGYRALLAADSGNYYGEHLLGVVALQRARLEEALGHFERAVAIAPQSAEAHNSLGDTYRRLGRTEQALENIRRAVALDGQLAEAQFNLGRVLQALGRDAEAIEALRRAVQINPEFAEAHAGLGVALGSAGELDEGLASCQRALALDAAPAAVHLNVGNLLLAKGFIDEAAAAYRAALERDAGLAEAHNNLGNIMRQRGRIDEALVCYEQALLANPDLAEALLNAAQLLRENRRLEEAINAYRLLLEARPNLAEAHFDLGNALKGVGDARAALACYARALEIDPEYAEARWALAMSQLPLVAETDAELEQGCAAFAAELAALERWCNALGAEKTARAVGTQQPFYLAYREADHREVMARYGALWAGLMGAWQAATRLPMPAPVTRAQIRVGIVSAHIRDHSVWNAIAKGWLKHLDRARFDVRLFHLGNANDVETALAKTLATHYVYGKSDIVEWTQLILGHQLDVLIYPEIGMDPVTAKLASLRLAPVQAASWGHPHTSGLPTIDAFLSADALEPPGAEAHYTERLVRLPGLGVCIEPQKAAPREVDLAALGLRADVPLLVCAGTPFKYAPRHDAVLAQIARRLGDCQLVFFAPEIPQLMQRLRDRLQRGFAAEGVDFPATVVIAPWLDRGSFHGLLSQADVYLDTMGFSGFNTALQAIECGLPVAAWEGQFLRGRLASGLLRRMGLDELVARSEAEYVQIAVRLAQDAAYWGEVRERMIAARARLYGDVEPVRALERYLEEAVRK